VSGPGIHQALELRHSLGGSAGKGFGSSTAKMPAILKQRSVPGRFSVVHGYSNRTMLKQLLRLSSPMQASCFDGDKVIRSNTVFPQVRLVLYSSFINKAGWQAPVVPAWPCSFQKAQMAPYRGACQLGAVAPLLAYCTL